MTQDKAHPTPPAVPSEREAFKTWMVANKRWISLAEYPSGKFVHTPTELMVEAWIAGRAVQSLAAPVASNTTAEPAPIQPAGVEVESLPELPEPLIESTQCNSTMRYTTIQSYSATQMRAYALQALAAASQGDRGKT